MKNQKSFNRGFVVLGAILIQLALGAIYAWSVYTKLLVEAGWSRAETQMVFSAGLALFAIVMVIAGRMMPIVGPRKLAFSGGIVLGLGYILAGLFGAENFITTFLFVGILGGSGIGLGYVVPIAVGMRWFPDKKGYDYRAGSCRLWIWRHTMDGPGRPVGTSWRGELLASIGLSKTFIVYGIAYLIIVSIGSIWMVFPPERVAAGRICTAGGHEKKLSRHHQFYQ
jgi:MFS transporter, OFA family, oxalate/formate antiporter